MTHIALHRLPRPVLAHGMPLRALVQLAGDHDPWQKVSLVLHPLSAPAATAAVIAFEQAPHREDRYLLDMEAGRVAEYGCYEGEIIVGEERRGLDTSIWIVDDESYARFRREIAAEPFVPSRGLHAEAAGRFVDDVMRAAFEEDRFDLDPATVASTVRHKGDTREQLYPASALRWLAEHVAMHLRYVAACGARFFVWYVLLERDRFGITATAAVEPAVAKAWTDGTLEASGRDLQYVEYAPGKEVRIRTGWHPESSILEIQADMALQGIPIESRG